MVKHTFFSLLAIAIVVIGCGPPTQEDTGLTVFRYNEPGGITSLDPAFARHTENTWAVNQLFNGLVQMDDQLRVQPCIAKSWSVSDSGLVYTFKLRNDVYFHDHELFEGGHGRAVTAEDFAYSFWRIIDEDVASPGAWLFNYLDRSEKSNYLGFIAENSNTLKIFLKKPFPPFLSILTMQYCAVVPKEVVEYYGADFRRNPVGTGPFLFKNWVEGTKLVFAKNHNYFESENGNQLPYLDAVSVTFSKDRKLTFLDFIRGGYDFMSVLEENKDQAFDQDGNLLAEYEGKFKVHKLPYLKTDYIGILVDDKSGINSNKNLNIKEIRKAISYGFNRSELVRFLRNNRGVPANAGFVPRGLPSYSEQDFKGYKYDPKRAGELLTLAGYPNGKGLPSIKLTTTITAQNICEYIQHELSEIGINVEIDVIDDAAYRQMVAQGKLSMFSKNWIADYPDAENFLTLFYSENHSPKGPNYTRYNNFKFDQLYERAMAETNDSARYVLYRQMDQIVMEDAPVIPLFYDEVIRFVHHNIEGLESNPMNLLNLKRVKKN